VKLVAADASQRTAAVVKNGVISIKADATVKDVVDAVYDAKADLKFEAEVVAGVANNTLAVVGTHKLTGGETAVGKVEVKLDKKATAVSNVVINNKDYAATLADNGLSFTINTSADAVVGKTVKANVTSVEGRVTPITVVIN